MNFFNLKEFTAAADKIKQLKSKPTDQELLDIYALFKQASVGDNTTDRPGTFSIDFKGILNKLQYSTIKTNTN